MRLIAPSLLAADFLHLGEAAEIVNANADIFHVDVMDGCLVPNISFGFPVMDAVAPVARKPLDVHLMIVKPEKYIPRFASAGASMISFHLEAARQEGSDPRDIIRLIHENGCKAGLAINPDIPVEDTFPYLADLDYILVMSVFAGFGGQKFIEETPSRVAAVKAELDRIGKKDCLIEVDGGVCTANADMLAKAGVSIFVAGSSVFKAKDPSAAVRALKGEFQIT